MKVVIISDVHGNAEALRALPERYDELWVLGDLVGYGPQPGEVMDAIREAAAVAVRGNHDHAAGHPEEDGRWSSRARAAAEATRRYTTGVLTGDQRAYLRDLPLTAAVERDGARFFLAHATPSDPLYGRCRTDEEWAREVAGVPADLVLVGHTHIPTVRPVGGRLVVTPGSLGQPRNGRAEARYAVWEDGRIDLRSFPYPVEAAVERLHAIGLPAGVEQGLIDRLRTGSAE